MDINQLRSGINALDDTILQAFTERMQLCRQIAEYKHAHHLPIYQAEREQAVIDRVRAQVSPDMAQAAATLFAAIMDISKCHQQEIIPLPAPIPEPKVCILPDDANVVCQGTTGSNSEAAALQLFPDACPTFVTEFEDVCRAVISGACDYGILPIQNSTAGTVARNYELLRQYPIFIVQTTTVRIDHCLAVRPGVTLSDIRTVCSHPQAIRQCSAYLRRQSWEQVACGNTAMAAQQLTMTDKPLAAICSPQCAAQYGLQVLAYDIADCIPNYTQFICISRELQCTAGADTISVALSLPHTAGSLYRLLTKFYASGMDLLRLESRPIANGSFDVLFYLDFRGNIADHKVMAMLRELSQSLEYFKFLGNHAETNKIK